MSVENKSHNFFIFCNDNNQLKYYLDSLFFWEKLNLWIFYVFDKWSRKEDIDGNEKMKKSDVGYLHFSFYSTDQVNTLVLSVLGVVKVKISKITFLKVNFSGRAKTKTCHYIYIFLNNKMSYIILILLKSIFFYKFGLKIYFTNSKTLAFVSITSKLKEINATSKFGYMI